jgi:hypothetical protein
MSVQTDIAKEISMALSGLSHNVSLRDADGKATVDPEQAQYVYMLDHDVMVLINDDNTDVELWYSSGKDVAEFVRNEVSPMIRNIAKNYLYGVTLKSYDGEIEPKNFIHRTKTFESRNTNRTSYHPLGTTKIIVRHSKAVDETSRGARSRNIGDLFIENNGERFRYPHKHLMAARVMALHVDQGGRPWDDLGEKIIEMSRRRKEIMELLRWSKRLDENPQLDEIKKKAKHEVLMIRRVMERAARTGNLEGVVDYTLPERKPVTEAEIAIMTQKRINPNALPGLEYIKVDTLVTEVLHNFAKKIL